MSEHVATALLTLRVSSTALLVALLLGVPAGAWLALRRAAGRRLILTAVNAGMGLPPVLAGLVITYLLWRTGPLGWLELLYTPAAMVIAQVVLALPIVIGLAAASIQQLGPQLPEQLAGLGAGPLQIGWLVIRQARLPLLAAAMAAAGRLLSEVGAAMMVGGNIKGETRVLTTDIVLQARSGNFEAAARLSLVLLGIAFAVNALLTWAQQRSAQRESGSA